MKKMIPVALFLAGLFLAIPAISQTSSNTNEKVARQLNLLLQLKGLWETDAATMKTGGKEYKFAYYADFKPASGNKAIVMHEWANIPGMGKLDGNNLAGINLSDGKVHWFSVDNMGTTHEHIGEFADDKHFTMIHQGTQDGKEFIEKLEMELSKPDVLILNQVAMLDGEEVAVINGVFHRKKGN